MEQSGSLSATRMARSLLFHARFGGSLSDGEKVAPLPGGLALLFDLNSDPGAQIGA
jgi:hypothetical protein